METTEAKEGTAMNTTTKRTTIVTHPDGTVSKRTSKTKVYEYAVEHAITHARIAENFAKAERAAQDEMAKIDETKDGALVAFVDWKTSYDGNLSTWITLYRVADYTGETVIETPGGTNNSHNSRTLGGAAIFAAFEKANPKMQFAGLIVDRDYHTAADLIAQRLVTGDLSAEAAVKIAETIKRVQQRIDRNAEGFDQHASLPGSVYSIHSWSSRRDLAEKAMRGHYTDGGTFRVVECQCA